MNKKRLISSLVVITLAIVAVVGGTSAYFSDTETSTNNVLRAGAIDLKVDNSSYYNYLACVEVDDGVYEWQNTGQHRYADPFMEDLIGTPCSLSWASQDLDGQLFFDFHDLKPGDWGEDTISLHVDNNDSYLCMDIDVTSTPENEQTEPEAKVDQTDGVNEGELQDHLKWVWWADDGDNVLEDTEEQYIFAENVGLGDLGTVALADAENNVWGDEGPFPGGEDPKEYTRYIAKAWCFGDLTLAPVANGEETHWPYNDPGVRCNGGLEDLNVAQTDGITADITFTAVQSRHNGNYTCAECELEGRGFGDDVSSYSQGTLKNGGAVTDPNRTDPARALGVQDGAFYSLGYGGWIVIELDGPITGDRVATIEVTNGRDTYPEENAIVYVGETPAGPWVEVGTASNQDNGTGVSYFDITGTGLSEIRYVRIVDDTNPDIHNSTSDAYDLDAVNALVCLDEEEPEEPPKTDQT